MDWFAPDMQDLDALAFDMMATDTFGWRLEMGFLTPPEVEDNALPPECDTCLDDGCMECAEEPDYEPDDYDDPDGWMEAQDRYDAMVYGP